MWSGGESLREMEVDQLMLNAELRNELEPFADESLYWLQQSLVPTEVENQYLREMLAWECAPALPIAQWFTPELRPAAPESLNDDQLHHALWDALAQLSERNVVLEFTDHLSDRELYTLIVRHILPSREKKLDLPERFLHWDCAHVNGEDDAWLRYYASEEDRQRWAAESGCTLPPHEDPPYIRPLPSRPMET